jgi:hypothetical protein
LKTDHRSASSPASKSAPPPIAAARLPAGLIAVGVAFSLTPGLQDRLERGADRFRDRHA